MVAQQVIHPAFQALLVALHPLSDPTSAGRIIAGPGMPGWDGCHGHYDRRKINTMRDTAICRCGDSRLFGGPNRDLEVVPQVGSGSGVPIGRYDRLHPLAVTVV